MQREQFKRGDTFDYGGDARLLIDSVEESFSGVTIEGVLAADNGQGEPDASEPFATIAGEWLDESTGDFHIEEAKEDTADWPIGPAVFDIAFTWPDGRRLTTSTMLLQIVRAARDTTA